MMMYINMFSSAFTALGLIVNLEVLSVWAFVTTNPSILLHIGVMAICSAVGQLFIFYTIKRFGPLVFATIQTVRQLLSIVLSILLFSHPVNSQMMSGVALVFAALGGQIYYKYKNRKVTAPKPLTPPEPAKEIEMDTPKDTQSLLPR